MSDPFAYFSINDYGAWEETSDPTAHALYEHPDPRVAELEAMKTYIDDVCTMLCGPYRWCDDVIVLRKIEQLLKDGNKLLGNK